MSYNPYWLGLAIVFEVIATNGMQYGRPLVLVVAGYVCAFYLLSLALRTIPIGVAYAIWSGVGIVMVSLIGYVLYRQRLTLMEICGIGLIAAGVIVLNLYAK